MNYQALKNELQNDPNGYGYAGPLAAGQTSILADMLNENRNTIDIDRELIPAYEIFEAIVPAEWAAISSQEKQRIQIILSLAEVNAAGPNTRAAFQSAFASGTTTRANLLALLTRKGSRAEQLFSRPVTRIDVAKALEV